jgi:hypothetical protein
LFRVLVVEQQVERGQAPPATLCRGAFALVIGPHDEKEKRADGHED